MRPRTRRSERMRRSRSARSGWPEESGAAARASGAGARASAAGGGTAGARPASWAAGRFSAVICRVPFSSGFTVTPSGAGRAALGGGRPGGAEGDHYTAQPRADGFVQAAMTEASGTGLAIETQAGGIDDQARRNPERDEAGPDRLGAFRGQHEVV